MAVERLTLAPPPVKRGKRFARKEEVLELPGYAALERDIMGMMRQQAR